VRRPSTDVPTLRRAGARRRWGRGPRGWWRACPREPADHTRRHLRWRVMHTRRGARQPGAPGSPALGLAHQGGRHTGPTGRGGSDHREHGRRDGAAPAGADGPCGHEGGAAAPNRRGSDDRGRRGCRRHGRQREPTPPPRRSGADRGGAARRRPPRDAETSARGQGRMEPRRCTTVRPSAGLVRGPAWRQCSRGSARDHPTTGQVRSETVDGVTRLASPRATPARILELVRGHGPIEHPSHGVREVTGDADAPRDDVATCRR